jgi:hypothetical protein
MPIPNLPARSEGVENTRKVASEGKPYRLSLAAWRLYLGRGGADTRRVCNDSTLKTCGFLPAYAGWSSRRLPFPSSKINQ